MTKEKEKDKLFGDDFDNPNSMKEFENYVEFDIDSSTTTFYDDAKSIIDGIASAYLSLPENINTEDQHYIAAKKLIDNIKLIETTNLHVMIEQVRIAKHLLHTMIRRLDSGGHVNDSIYDTIREQQKQLMNIVLQFSKYARNLPDYFSITKSELNSTMPLSIAEVQQLNSGQEIKQLHQGDDETYSTEPIRGTLDLALSVQASIQKVSEKYAEKQANEISFDPEQLTEDLDDDDDVDDLFSQQNN